jgi:hypothetical protein
MGKVSDGQSGNGQWKTVGVQKVVKGARGGPESFFPADEADDVDPSEETDCDLALA